MLGRAMSKTTSILPGRRAKRMSRMRASVYYLSGWITLLTAIFVIYCDRLGKAAEAEQYKLVSRLRTIPSARRCENPSTGLLHPTHQWLRAPVYVKDSFHIPTAIEANRTSRSRCHVTPTRSATVYGLPKAKDGIIELTAGPVHEIRIVSIGPNGENRCAGGDYYETDLISTFWRSRPPIIDVQDGSYRVSLQVDMRFAGLYVFRIVLLFPNFHGLDPPPDSLPVEGNNPWARMQEIQNLKIRFVVPMTNSDKGKGTCSPQLATCTKSDFTLRKWVGRWTRDEFNMLCEADQELSFSKCLKARAQCVKPWCRGPVGLLHSNGWVYSAHCSFRIFTRDEAWSCLNRKWLFWVGDSTELETVRNLLTIVLGLEDVDSVLDQDDVDHKFVRPLYRRPLKVLENVGSLSTHDPHQESDRNSLRRGRGPNGTHSRLQANNLNYRGGRSRIEGNVSQHKNHELIQSDRSLRIPEETVPDSVLKAKDDIRSVRVVEKQRKPEQSIHKRISIAQNVEPEKKAQFIRVSFVHNGDVKTSSQPLYSAANANFLKLIKAGFFWGTTPDFIVVDFGLRNAWYLRDAANFVDEGLKLAIAFWRKILCELFPRFPLFIYRSAFAVAGRTRTTYLNPHKVELYNRIIAEKLEELQIDFPNVRMLDAFDMSFPWHFDHNLSIDGLHYGTARTENGRQGYFVNLMLVHVLLNTMCEVPATSKGGSVRNSGH